MGIPFTNFLDCCEDSTHSVQEIASSEYMLAIFMVNSFLCARNHWNPQSILRTKNHYYLYFADESKKDRLSTCPTSQRYEKAMPRFQSLQSGHYSPCKKSFDTLRKTTWIWIPGNLPDMWNLICSLLLLFPMLPHSHLSQKQRKDKN